MIEGKQVNLRAIRREDIDIIYDHTSKVAEIGEHWPLYLPNKIRMIKKFEETGNWDNDSGMLVITDKQGTVVGTIGFFKFLEYADGYEIGYRILKPELRGRGYMTEALKMFCAFMFESKPIKRLQVNFLKGNYASEKVAEKCGFVKEGVLRSVCFHKGEYIDLELSSILREECPSLEEVTGRCELE